ncbi:Aste57867_20995 [Aphanomyces stellatus]|uniref:Aste57867_20995 protein n=1 Tax=Aphanomyces stellatus TaxID=120398 RepID=A0A485LGZ8_9STRA|nr:hypothetical protein As57867_020927 [Aphanomyces stellatus]VFT97670.1 Aste57867_20995 [Aphanomyces stellatus]
MADEEARIELLHVSDGYIAQYPLLLLEGKFHCNWELPDNVLAEVTLNDSATYWPVSHAGVFKALVLLPAYGRHEICLNIAEAYHILSVEYVPSTRAHRISFYYQKGSGSAGTFDAPPGVDNSVAAAVKKIQFNAMLLQTAMASLLAAQGVHETFALEVDENGQPVVHVLESSFTDDEARAITDHELMDRVEEDLKSNGYVTDHAKHIVILGSSKYDVQSKAPKGHTALGGSRVGLFGSCGLHTWASHVGDVMQCFLDATKIDPSLLWDDSAGRGTYAANYSTGIGAVLHELGHTLGLGHASHGIMARGFDDMNCLFSVVKPKPTAAVTYTNAFPDGKLFLKYDGVVDVTSPEGAHWHRVSALKLRRSPWLSLTPRTPNPTPPTISWRGSIAGPVGCGTGSQTVFGTDSKDVAGFLIQSDDTGVHSIEVLTNAALNDLLFCGLAASGTQDLFILMDGEFIAQVDVRAKAWVDAIRFHTNFRVSRFFGGKGGQLHALKAPAGQAIYSLFGSQGEKTVGCIGAYVAPVPRHVTSPSHTPTPSPISSPPPAPATGGSFFDQIGNLFNQGASTTPAVATSGAFAKTGAGIEENQDDFSTKTIQSMGAILLTCTDSIVGFRVLSRADYTKAFADGFYTAPNELVFALAAHELLVQVDVRSSGWIHGMRFHTNLRISPWYGGFDGDEHSFACAPDACITGFYGSHGPQYLGTLGAYFGPAPRLPRPLPNRNSLTPSPSGNSGVHHVSIRSTPTFVAVSNDEHAADGSFEGAFVLHKDETLVQVDLVRLHNVIVGACFHTSARSSKWYGSTVGDYDAVVAPAGQAFAAICISSTGVDYTFESESHCRVTDARPVPAGVTVDAGQGNVTVAAADGVAFVVLSTFNNGDPLVETLVEFPRVTDLPPTWRLSTTYLQSKVPSPLPEYCLEVVDDTGASTLSPVLPACVA